MAFLSSKKPVDRLNETLKDLRSHPDKVQAQDIIFLFGKDVKTESLTKIIKHIHTLPLIEELIQDSTKVMEEYKDLLHEQKEHIIVNDITNGNITLNAQNHNLLDNMKHENSYVKIYAKTKDAESKNLLIGKIKKEKNLLKILKDEEDKDFTIKILSNISDYETLKKCTQKNQSRLLKKHAKERLEELFPSEKVNDKSESKLNELWAQVSSFQTTPEWEYWDQLVEETSAQALKKLDPESAHPITEKIKTAMEGLLEQAQTFSHIRAKLEEVFKGLKEEMGEKFSDKDIQELKEKYHSSKVDLLPQIYREPFENLFQGILENYAKNEYSNEKIKKLIPYFEKKLVDIKLLGQQFVEQQGKGNISLTIKKKYHGLLGELEKKGLSLDVIENLNSEYKTIIGHTKNIIQNFRKQQEDRAQLIKEAQNTIEKLVAKMSEVADNSELKNWKEVVKPLLSEWKDLEKSFPRLTDKFQDAFLTPYMKLSQAKKQVWEDHEWERWANTQKIKQVIEDLKVKMKDLTDDNLSSTLRNISQEVRKIGPLSKTKGGALWKEYKTMYGTMLKRGLEQKKSIIEKLKSITTENPVEHVEDFKKRVKEIKGLQKYWNEIGILPTKEDESLFKHFRALCDQFFDPKNESNKFLNEERGENLKRKNELLKEAKKLARGKESFEEKLKSFIFLQKKWKTIGPVPQSDGNKVWDNFKGTCNKFFEEFEAYKQANLKLKNELFEEWKTWFEANKTDVGMVQNQKIKDFQQRWNTIGALPLKEERELNQEFRNMTNVYFKKEKEEIKKGKEDKVQSLKDKKKLLQDYKVQLIKSFDEKAQYSGLKESLDTLTAEVNNSPKTFVDREKHIQEWLKATTQFFGQLALDTSANTVEPARYTQLNKIKKLNAAIEAVLRLKVLGKLGGESFADGKPCNSFEKALEDLSAPHKGLELKAGMEYTRKVGANKKGDAFKKNLLTETMGLVKGWKSYVAFVKAEPGLGVLFATTALSLLETSL